MREPLRDEEGYGYVIVARAKKRDPITLKAQSGRITRLQNGWEVSEFGYQPHKWKRRHRYVVVRRPIPEDPVEAGQLTLFKDIKYAYLVFVTNLKMRAWLVYLFYSPRARIEKHIRSALLRFIIKPFPPGQWAASSPARAAAAFCCCSCRRIAASA